MKVRQIVPFATGLIIGSVFFSLVVSAWTAPTLAPPNGNASAPVNVSATAQSKTGPLGVGGLAVFGNTALQGTTTATDEMSVTLGSRPGQYRMINGNYGSFFRNDGANTYFLLTASGDQYGSWNALRPLYVNDSSGLVSMSNGLTVVTPNLTTNAIVGTGPGSGTSGYGVYGQSGTGTYFGALGRADGYSFVGVGALWNQGNMYINGAGNGITFPDGSVQKTTHISSVTVAAAGGGSSNATVVAICPAGYVVSGCGHQLTSWGGGGVTSPDTLYPAGDRCIAVFGTDYWSGGNIYANCLKIQ